MSTCVYAHFTDALKEIIESPHLLVCRQTHTHTHTHTTHTHTHTQTTHTHHAHTHTHSTTQMSITLINMLLGPPLFRLALVRVGEIKNTGTGMLVFNFAVRYGSHDCFGIQGAQSQSLCGVRGELTQQPLESVTPSGMVHHRERNYLYKVLS